jgi:hypothetical protein
MLKRAVSTVSAKTIIRILVTTALVAERPTPWASLSDSNPRTHPTTVMRTAKTRLFVKLSARWVELSATRVRFV